MARQEVSSKTANCLAKRAAFKPEVPLVSSPGFYIEKTPGRDDKVKGVSSRLLESPAANRSVERFFVRTKCISAVLTLGPNSDLLHLVMMNGREFSVKFKKDSMEKMTFQMSSRGPIQILGPKAFEKELTSGAIFSIRVQTNGNGKHSVPEPQTIIFDKNDGSRLVLTLAPESVCRYDMT